MVWQDEARTFATRDLSGTDYVYLWVDGIHLKVLSSRRSCVCWVSRRALDSPQDD